MAQNIALSWLGGSRILELKTVQINDQLVINCPCIDMTNVSVMNCDTFVQWTSGLVAAANVTYCTGTVNVGPCINWGVANIPTRGLREIGNSWNEPTANVFLGHAQNDARVMRRQNFSATANMSETGIVP